jgi:hypothetical protein
MSLDPRIIAKGLSSKRCDRDNIKEMTKIFTLINDRVKQMVEKIFSDGARLKERESRELQLLLKTQEKLQLMPLDHGSRAVDMNLYDNQRHRVVYLREAIKEIERRYKFKLLDDVL